MISKLQKKLQIIVLIIKNKQKAYPKDTSFLASYVKRDFGGGPFC